MAHSGNIRHQYQYGITGVAQGNFRGIHLHERRKETEPQTQLAVGNRQQDHHGIAAFALSVYQGEQEETKDRAHRNPLHFVSHERRTSGI